MNPSTLEVIGPLLFAVALIHTFSTKFFERLAHRKPKHAGLWHCCWAKSRSCLASGALVLVLFIFGLQGSSKARSTSTATNYTEPLFVFAIMVVAGTRPARSSRATSWASRQAHCRCPCDGALLSDPHARAAARPRSSPNLLP